MYPTVKMDATAVGKNRSADLWRGALDKFANDPSVGTLYRNDFHTPITIGTVATGADGWFLGEAGTTGATAEGFSTINGADGIVSLIGTTGTDLQGVQAQAGISATVGESITLPTHTTEPLSDVIFETRVRLDLDENDTLFIGLAEPSAAANTLLLNDNTLSLALDYIGFYRLNGGDLQFVVRNDNNGGTAVEYAVDIKASTFLDDVGVDEAYHKLGFRVNADRTVEVFFDEVKIVATSDTGVAIAVPSTALPIEYLTRVLACARGATADNATVALPCDFIDCLVEN